MWRIGAAVLMLLLLASCEYSYNCGGGLEYQISEFKAEHKEKNGGEHILLSFKIEGVTTKQEGGKYAADLESKLTITYPEVEGNPNFWASNPEVIEPDLDQENSENFDWVSYTLPILEQLGDLPPGTYKFELEVEDKLGNQKKSATTSVDIP